MRLYNLKIKLFLLLTFIQLYLSGNTTGQETPIELKVIGEIQIINPEDYKKEGLFQLFLRDIDQNRVDNYEVEYKVKSGELVTIPMSVEFNPSLPGIDRLYENINKYLAFEFVYKLDPSANGKSIKSHAKPKPLAQPRNTYQALPPLLFDIEIQNLSDIDFLFKYMNVKLKPFLIDEESPKLLSPSIKLAFSKEKGLHNYNTENVIIDSLLNQNNIFKRVIDDQKIQITEMNKSQIIISLSRFNGISFYWNGYFSKRNFVFKDLGFGISSSLSPNWFIKGSIMASARYFETNIHYSPMVDGLLTRTISHKHHLYFTSTMGYCVMEILEIEIGPSFISEIGSELVSVLDRNGLVVFEDNNNLNYSISSNPLFNLGLTSGIALRVFNFSIGLRLINSQFRPNYFFGISYYFI